MALTFGAARAGALPNDAGRDAGGQRAVAVLPRIVQQAERRLQRERPDVRIAAASFAAGPSLGPEQCGQAAGRAECIAPLREGLLDLPPPGLV